MRLSYEDNARDEGLKLTRKLRDLGIYREIADPEIQIEYGKISYGYGYSIKAIEKFLGYYDPKYHIPFNPSISFRTDFSLCEACCMAVKGMERDHIVFNGNYNERYQLRGETALNVFREMTGIKDHFLFYIRMTRRYERAKGLSESAAVAAAVSMALLRNVMTGEPEAEQISRFAKLVSGSGTRSSIDGFSFWQAYPGIMERDSFAFRIPVNYGRFYFAAFPQYVKVETSDLHSIVKESPLFQQWVTMKFPIINNIIENSFKLNDLMTRSLQEMVSLANVAKSVGREIHNDMTLTVIEKVIGFRKRGLNIFVTTDTGPSAVVMTDEKSILDEFLMNTPLPSVQGHIPENREPASKSSFIKEFVEFGMMK